MMKKKKIPKKIKNSKINKMNNLIMKSKNKNGQEINQKLQTVIKMSFNWLKTKKIPNMPNNKV